MFAADRNFWENLSEDPFIHSYFIKNMPVIKIHVMKLHTHRARHSSNSKIVLVKGHIYFFRNEYHETSFLKNIDFSRNEYLETSFLKHLIFLETSISKRASDSIDFFSKLHSYAHPKPIRIN